MTLGFGTVWQRAATALFGALIAVLCFVALGALSRVEALDSRVREVEVYQAGMRAELVAINRRLDEILTRLERGRGE